MASRSPAEARARVEASIDLALAWLLAEAGRGFPSALHRMSFPRWAGFTGPEAQCGDGFVRSVVAMALLDAVDVLPDRPTAQLALRDLARHEADRLAAAQLSDRHGGWSYFPDLPELPPDLDSLSAALALFARVAPQHLALARRPIELAFAGQAASGGCPTWLIDPQDAPQSRACMNRAVAQHWGDTLDVDVNARFAAALTAADRTAEGLGRLLGFVQAAQGGDGLWPATWYWSPLVPSELALADLALPGPARAAALAAVRSRQQADGGWGEVDATTLETALATSILAATDPRAAARGAAWLCDNQTRRGAWRASPWIRMDIGRAGGATGRSAYSARFGSEAVETAVALRALARARDCL